MLYAGTAITLAGGALLYFSTTGKNISNLDGGSNTTSIPSVQSGGGSSKRHKKHHKKTYKNK